MKSFIVADTRDPFLADVATRMIMDDGRELELLATANNIDKVHTLMSSKTPDLLLISKDIADEQENWDYGNCVVAAYATNAEDCEDLKGRGLNCLGVIRNASQLLNLAEMPIRQERQERQERPERRPSGRERRADFEDLPSDDNVDETQEPDYWQPKKAPNQNKAQQRRADEPRESRREDRYTRQSEQYNASNEYEPTSVANNYRQKRDFDHNHGTQIDMEEIGHTLSNGRPEYDTAYNHGEKAEHWDNEPKNRRQDRRTSRNYDDEPDRRRYENEMRRPYHEHGYEYEEEPERGNPRDKQGSFSATERYYGAKSAERRYEKDMIRSREKRTTTVTVYAAKGGVGKSTIATQTAVCLALTSGGREKYRVCIVDYNIDFGDVRPMLGMNNDGPDMYYWVMDIKDRLKAGERPEDIWYSRSEIEEYLQVMNRIGLYVLCAPNSHQESMAIESIELEIMLRNITQKGGFDFVVCDTGNNTRDSSIIALEAANYVLLVATQDVTAASCNASVIEALDRFGLDLDRVRLIVNNILSVKYTGIDVESVESYFSKYPCIARIRHNLDIVKSNNLNEPIVLQANHEITKEFRKIVAFLTGTEGEMSKPKKGFNLFRRGKKG